MVFLQGKIVTVHISKVQTHKLLPFKRAITVDSGLMFPFMSGDPFKPDTVKSFNPSVLIVLRLSSLVFKSRIWGLCFVPLSLISWPTFGVTGTQVISRSGFISFFSCVYTFFYIFRQTSARTQFIQVSQALNFNNLDYLPCLNYRFC